ncbi:hypothetical protein OX284_015005 [Flavobacterium sp. SUN046]|uniref:hypothetical protein n=1 Tax=Flavobacterium sp. SUN046 TaxID=3002440 RepID=UPI002DB62103|nr:hypothetical protein [Flavobacterium sp. SUN046]MEC4050746.1 hypothetical protein [Flavobacterium sp. SUN046]
MNRNTLDAAHLSLEQKTTIDAGIDSIEEVVIAVTMAFSKDERRRYGSVNEQNKLFINKVNDYKENQPELKSPDVDWNKFEADYADRTFADTRMFRIENIMRMLSDFKIAHDYDNHKMSLKDYEYSQYKQGMEIPGFAEKVSELKQFFPHTKGGAKK